MEIFRKTSLRKILISIEIIPCDYIQSQDLITYKVKIKISLSIHTCFLVSSQFSPHWKPLFAIWGRSPISLSSFQLSLLKPSISSMIPAVAF